MTVGKTGLLALGLCIAVLPAAYASDTPDPLEQLRQGAEPREVSCSGDFVLLMSPDGGPACVSTPTSTVLESRGWELVLQPHTNGTETNNSGNPLIASAPERYLAHPNTMLELSKYPVVGEIVDLTVMTDYGERPPEFFGQNEYPIVKIDITSAEPDRYRVFDIVANIETGDEDTFAPYDFEATTVVAAPEVAYILKAKLEILREGVAHVSMRGFDGDILVEPVAASYEKSMPYYEYVNTGQTYLDDLWAAEAAASAHIWEGEVRYPYAPPEPPFEDLRTEEEMERDWFTQIAQYYVGTESTEIDVARQMLELGYGEDKVYSFLLEYMEYDLELVEQIDIRSLLASLYKKYDWYDDWSEDDIVDDLIQRHYGPDSIREFFVDYLDYAPDQADRLDVKNALAGYYDLYVLEILQRWGYVEDDIREFFVEYKGYTEEEAQAVVADGLDPEWRGKQKLYSDEVSFVPISR